MLNYNSLLPGNGYNDAAVDYNSVAYSGSAGVSETATAADVPVAQAAFVVARAETATAADAPVAQAAFVVARAETATALEVSNALKQASFRADAETAIRTAPQATYLVTRGVLVSYCYIDTPPT